MACKTCGDNDNFFTPAVPNCNFVYGPCKECCGHSLGRIKKDFDPCKSCCVIPAITAETADGITKLANCFVHVNKNNTTYYVDDKHRPMITWAGPIEIEHYDYVNNPDGFRSQTCFCLVEVRMTFGGNAEPPVIVPGEVYFDADGNYHVVGFDINAYIDIIEGGLDDQEEA